MLFELWSGLEFPGVSVSLGLVPVGLGPFSRDVRPVVKVGRRLVGGEVLRFCEDWGGRLYLSAAGSFWFEDSDSEVSGV